MTQEAVQLGALGRTTVSNDKIAFFVSLNASLKRLSFIEAAEVNDWPILLWEDKCRNWRNIVRIISILCLKV